MKYETGRYFDYACPYCYRGHQNLLELLKRHPEVEVAWKPCEAHPRPEPAAIHSDKAIEGMYFVEEKGGDLLRYHAAVYRAMFEASQDISDFMVLKACAAEAGIDEISFCTALQEGRYAQKVLAGNRDAWGDKGFDAVPSYTSGGRSIGSRDGVMVTKEELERFLSAQA